MKFLLLSGSFRKNSYSLCLLDVVSELLIAHQTARPQLDNLPFYSDDIEINDTAMSALIAQIEDADGIIVCTPEYNHSIPAVLKNAIDWASRPAFNSCLKDKPVTFITQAVSPVGGARAQAHLKLVFDACLSKLHNSHEMMIAGINQKFNAEMQLTDEQTRQRLQRHLDGFIQFIER
jgi:chromate reductase